MKKRAESDLEDFHQPVKRAIASINQYVRPEMVICFGWVTDGPLRIICNILVVTGGHEAKPLPEILAQFQRHFDNMDIDGKKGSVTVNWLLHSMSTVNRLIRWRNPLYCSIAQSGVLLYSNGCIPLPIVEYAWSSFYENAEDWNLCKGYGEQFQSLATLAADSGFYKFAVCNIYLALEQYGTAILKRYLGYKMTSPDINRLFELLYLVSPEFWKAFPDIGFGESYSLRLLRQAYVGISEPAELDISKDTVKSLLASMQKFYGCMTRLKASERTVFDDMV